MLYVTYYSKGIDGHVIIEHDLIVFLDHVIVGHGRVMSLDDHVIIEHDLILLVLLLLLATGKLCPSQSHTYDLRIVCSLLSCLTSEIWVVVVDALLDVSRYFRYLDNVLTICC